MANVIVHGLDHNALMRLLSEEMSLESMKLHIAYDPGSEEPRAKICDDNHLHLVIGLGMPLNVVFIYVLAAYLLCYSAHGKARGVLPSLREGMLAFEVFLRRSHNRTGALIEYTRSHHKDSQGLVFVYRDLCSLIQGNKYPQPVFMQMQRSSDKKEDLN